MADIVDRHLSFVRRMLDAAERQQDGVRAKALPVVVGRRVLGRPPPGRPVPGAGEVALAQVVPEAEEVIAATTPVLEPHVDDGSVARSMGDRGAHEPEVAVRQEIEAVSPSVRAVPARTAPLPTMAPSAIARVREGARVDEARRGALAAPSNAGSADAGASGIVGAVPASEGATSGGISAGIVQAARDVQPSQSASDGPGMPVVSGMFHAPVATRMPIAAASSSDTASTAVQGLPARPSAIVPGSAGFADARPGLPASRDTQVHTASADAIAGPFSSPVTPGNSGQTHGAFEARAQTGQAPAYRHATPPADSRDMRVYRTAGLARQQGPMQTVAASSEAASPADGKTQVVVQPLAESRTPDVSFVAASPWTASGRPVAASAAIVQGSADAASVAGMGGVDPPRALPGEREVNPPTRSDATSRVDAVPFVARTPVARAASALVSAWHPMDAVPGPLASGTSGAPGVPGDGLPSAVPLMIARRGARHMRESLPGQQQTDVPPNADPGEIRSVTQPATPSQAPALAMEEVHAAIHGSVVRTERSVDRSVEPARVHPVAMPLQAGSAPRDAVARAETIHRGSNAARAFANHGPGIPDLLAPKRAVVPDAAPPDRDAAVPADVAHGAATIDAPAAAWPVLQVPWTARVLERTDVPVASTRPAASLAADVPTPQARAGSIDRHPGLAALRTPAIARHTPAHQAPRPDTAAVPAKATRSVAADMLPDLLPLVTSAPAQGVQRQAAVQPGRAPFVQLDAAPPPPDHASGVVPVPGEAALHVPQAMGGPPDGATVGAGAVDMEEVIERAVQALMLKLEIERERRGFARWL
jgi:hypothetical protein